jgi:ABC-type multidrug transport system fused ATPase/permease subunit
VWFRYPNRTNEWVLKGLSLHIRPQETVALVGESGCGKSTLVALVMRFYDIEHGQIKVDGRDIREWDVQVLRKSMGLVQQEPTLFNYTIAENILYGNMHAYNSDILEAAQAANALDFISTSSAQQSGDALPLYEDTAEALLRELNLHANEAKATLGGES